MAALGARVRAVVTGRRFVAVVLVVGFCLGVVVTRAVLEGRAALARGDTAAAAADHAEAVTWWRRAARWYVPGAPHVGRAYDRLENLAREAAERGDDQTALAAWRGVRGSILATRSVFTPHAHRLDPANRAIAALMARVEGPRADPDATEEERVAWHYDLLARDEAPSVFWSIIALLGFGLWLGGGGLFALRGVTADDELVPRRAAWAGAMVALGLIIWMLGLYKA
jgi:hypothetical protein